MKNNTISILKNIVRNKQTEIHGLQERVILLNTAIERLECGCLYLDCLKHGSYIPEEIAIVRYYKGFHQK